MKQLTEIIQFLEIEKVFTSESPNLEKIKMKTKILLIGLLIAALNCLAAAQTKTNEPRTVTDFYLQLPSDFVNDSEGAEARRKRIAVEDLANGYLKLKPSADQDEREYTEIALFKKSGGGYVVAVANVGCAENCLSVARFLERRADRWVEVTDSVFPLTRDGQLVLYNRKKPPRIRITTRPRLSGRKPICHVKDEQFALDIRAKAKIKNLNCFL